MGISGLGLEAQEPMKLRRKGGVRLLENRYRLGM